MRNPPITLAYVFMLMLAAAGPGVAQDSGAQQPSAREQLQHIHKAQSIDQELAHLTKDLELTAEQQQQVRVLLEEHHDKLQTLFDNNPTASRQELGPQIHAVSDETHHKIHALLNDHQKELEKTMQERERDGQENRRSSPPALVTPQPSSWPSWYMDPAERVRLEGVLHTAALRSAENRDYGAQGTTCS
jgi:cytochrome c556